jgi:hypothetical protein
MMNERIFQLAKQAQIKFEAHLQHLGIDTAVITPADLEKFAELIVRECADHCDLLLNHKMSSEWSRGTHDCSKAIKKHFGV